MISTKGLVWAAMAAVMSAGCAGAAAEAPPPEIECTKEFADAMAMMCNVDQLAGLSPEEDPLSIGQKRTEWLSKNVDNPDSIYFRTILSVKGPTEQAVRIREQAKEVGLKSCALADSMEALSTGGLSP